ncbi:hypothetical protein GF327_00880, partial [Candidatus Woesearchaeota archaeon]|nr:hypothetical protein [Candidatus Woesearchaeota archaeon]
MQGKYKVAIFEADNKLVGFNIPTIYDMTKSPASGLLDLLSDLLYGQKILPNRFREKTTSAIPMQGPVYAASLINQKYDDVQAAVYIPGVSDRANSLDDIKEIIRDSDAVVVSSLTVNAWSQKEIIRIAKQENKPVIATGAHARMYEPARSLLAPGKMPKSRHDGYNDVLISYPGADYVIQHNHYDAFERLIGLLKEGENYIPRVLKIPGVGIFVPGLNNFNGLEQSPDSMKIPDIPDIEIDPEVIDNFEKVKMFGLTGSFQGCINNCDFCQIKEFMGRNFLYL